MSITYSLNGPNAHFLCFPISSTMVSPLKIYHKSTWDERICTLYASNYLKKCFFSWGRFRHFGMSQNPICQAGSAGSAAGRRGVVACRGQHAPRGRRPGRALAPMFAGLFACSMTLQRGVCMRRCPGRAQGAGQVGGGGASPQALGAPIRSWAPRHENVGAWTGGACCSLTTGFWPRPGGGGVSGDHWAIRRGRLCCSWTQVIGG